MIEYDHAQAIGALKSAARILENATRRTRLINAPPVMTRQALDVQIQDALAAVDTAREDLETARAHCRRPDLALVVHNPKET